jgi:2-deoxy-D-gluconate 3-dehydrogenase
LSASFDLSGKAAIVTGGNGGIGRGIALGLAGAGADVVIAARNEEKTAAVTAEIEALGRRCLGVACDVTLREDIDSVIAASLREFGRIDILVNNAGISGGGPPQSIPEETWDRVVNTNLKAGFLFSQAAFPALAGAGGGKVINIGSEYSIFGSAGVLPYSASKGGVIQMTKSLAVAWASSNIQVNAIIPGWVRTDMTAPVIDREPMYRGIVGRTPAGRFAEPEELAGAAVFLASSASDFITGQSIVVDGGYSIA